MDFFTLILIVSIIHCCFYFFDVFFRSCSMYPYIRFLQGTGLHISFFKISWFTKAFNRILHKWGSYRTRIIAPWFSLGVICTIILLPVSFVLLVQSIINVWSVSSNIDDKQMMVLEPMVPGINLPISDISYYVITLLVCSVIHELGHALAAVREDIPISGVGFIIFVLVPVAFVHLNSEQLSALAPKRLLNIYCAGVWHNLVLSLAAYVFLLMVPVFFYPIFEIGGGVSIQGIKEHSQIMGDKGLFVGDKVVAINDCEVSDSESWRVCLINALHQPAPGYCVTPDMVHELDESIPVKHLEGGVVECCSKSNSAHLCFEALEDDRPLQILQYSCLPARPVVTGSSYTCRNPIECPPGLHCVRPVLGNGTTLLRLQVHQGVNTHVIFLGHPLHVLYTVHTSDYHPIYKNIPSEIPEFVTRLAKYFAVFSLGFAVINVIPCFYLDGNHIMFALLLFLFEKNKNFKRMHRGISFSCNLFGTSLLLFNFSSILLKSIY